MPHSPARAFKFVSQAWSRERLAHSWLISGTEADCEALAARITALVLGLPESSPAPALAELPPSWLRVLRPEKKSRRIPVDSLRELERFFHLAAPRRQWKIAVIVAADRMMPEAANAFLKTMEEPPASCLILLLTEHPERLLPTVRSRCVALDLERGSTEPTREELAVTELLATFRPGEPPEFPHIATLRESFTAVLENKKAELLKAREGELAAEKKALRDRAETSWIEAREEALKAQVQADYLQWRARLVGVIGHWIGDALRQLEGAGSDLVLPGRAAETSAWARHFGRDQLIERLEAVSRLERLLETNVNETLLWEVSFLEIFGEAAPTR